MELDESLERDRDRARGFLPGFLPGFFDILALVVGEPFRRSCSPRSAATARPARTRSPEAASPRFEPRLGRRARGRRRAGRAARPFGRGHGPRARARPPRSRGAAPPAGARDDPRPLPETCAPARGHRLTDPRSGRWRPPLRGTAPARPHRPPCSHDDSHEATLTLLTLRHTASTPKGTQRTSWPLFERSCLHRYRQRLARRWGRIPSSRA